MSCPSPLSTEDLVAYFSDDLAASDLDRIEQHLMGCASCAAQAARMSALIEAVRAAIPPVVTREVLDALRARGTRIRENTFSPGARQEAVFTADVDLLVHRLSGLDLSNAERVQVTIRSEASGAVLLEEPNAPFDPKEGVLIACQRHYASMPPDTVFEVRAIDATGNERKAEYLIPHVFGP